MTQFRSAMKVFSMVALLGFLGCEADVAELGLAEYLPLRTVDPLEVPKISSFRCDRASGPAPLTLSCQWTVSAIKDAVSCKFDPGDGSSPYNMKKCAQSGEQVHQFNYAGQYKVKFLIADGTPASFNVSVSEPTEVNQPPEIKRFTGTPLRAAPPFESTLSWEIFDANAERLTCLLDVGDDGSADETLSPCTSSNTYKVPMASIGQKKVRLTVRDGRGLSATQMLTVEGQSSVGDLSIAKTEWGQSVISENPTLVGGKPALLRVHVVASKPGLSGVTARAEILSNGASVASVNLTAPATVPTAVDTSLSLAQQFRGTLPGDKLVAGVEIKVTVDPDGQLAEDNKANNTVTLKPSIGPERDIFLTSVPVIQGGTTGTVRDWEQVMQQVWPIRKIVNQTRAPYTFNGSLSSGGGGAWSSLLSQLATVKNQDGSKRQYYGFAKVNYVAGIAGIGYVGQLVSTGRDDSADTFAHEVGHNMGRPHAPCGGAAGPDPEYPSSPAYSGARIGSVGYDFVKEALVDPSVHKDLMSYCSPEWVSDFNYKKVQDFLTSRPPVANNMAPRIEMNSIYGIIGEDGNVEMGPINRVLSEVNEPTGETGRFSLRLHADGTQKDFPLHTQVTGEDPYHHHFTILTPYLGKMTAVEILRHGQVIYRREESTSSTQHTARIEEQQSQNLLKITWDASIHKYAMVAHLSEKERTTLTLELEGGEGFVSTQGLPEGGRFEVVLSDGLNPVRKEFARVSLPPLRQGPPNKVQ